LHGHSCGAAPRRDASCRSYTLRHPQTPLLLPAAADATSCLLTLCTHTLAHGRGLVPHCCWVPPHPNLCIQPPPIPSPSHPSALPALPPPRSRPRLLICDEATSALDTATERGIQASLKALAAGRTAVFVAHRLSTVQGCDRIYVLADGLVAEQGTHAQLMAGGQAAQVAPLARCRRAASHPATFTASSG
jgi:hypothetical protein